MVKYSELFPFANVGTLWMSDFTSLSSVVWNKYIM